MAERFDIDTELEQMRAIIDNPGLPQSTKSSLAKPILRRAEEERTKIGADLTHLNARERETQRILECLIAMEEWLRGPPTLRLEHNDCTRLHKLKEAAQAGEIVDGEKKETDGTAPAVWSWR